MEASFSSPARLKSIELQGYKTFASKTEFAFAPTITAIVGPNGVGKSNIADAIRWVLGEQSYRLLRAKRTEDIIFTGSDLRARAGMASATIVFDNSDGWLPIEFSEVSIGRRAYRDGNNEYLLNGQRVRLRDVVELLSECGLAERNYTIIGQGLVDAALSLRAEERRRLFEEAAGIGLHRMRRQEAERRLETAAHNLERAQDILAELRPHLRTLERQARRARDYDQVRTDLREALRIWYGFHWHSMQSEVVRRRTAARSQEAKRDDLRLRHERIDAELAEARRSIDRLRSDLHVLSQEVSRLYAQRESCGRRLAVAQERQRWLSDQETFLNSEVASLDERRTMLKERLKRAGLEVERRHEAVAAAQYSLEAPGADDGRRQRAGLAARLRELQALQEKLLTERAAWDAQLSQLADGANGLTERQNALRKDVSAARTAMQEAATQVSVLENELQAAQRDLERAEMANEASRKRVADLETEQATLDALATEIRTKHDATEARLEVLQQTMHAEKRIAEELRRASDRGDLKGIIGNLSDAIKVDDAYRRAIAALLGTFIQGTVFETSDDVERGLAFLGRRDNEERAALLPREPLRDAPLLETPDDDGCLGNAAGLVEVPAAFRRLTDALLGQALVVEDRETARRLAGSLPPDGRLVTRSGEVFYPSGAVVVGLGHSVAVTASRVAELEADLAELKAERESSQERVRTLAADLDAARAATDEAHSGAEHARRMEAEAQLRLEKGLLVKQEAERRHDFLAGQGELLETEIARFEEARREVEAKGAKFELEREALEAELDVVQAQLQPGEEARQEFGSPLEMASRAEQSARGRLVDIELELKNLEREAQDWQRRLSTARAEQQALGSEIEQASQEVDAVEARLQEIAANSQPAEQTLSQTEDVRAKLEAEESLTRSLLQEAERGHSHLQIDLARREEELASLRRRIEDDFGLVMFEEDTALVGQDPLPMQGLVERLPRVEEVPLDIQTQIGRLRAQLRRMGAVNPEAQREYEEVRERVDFLTKQLEDSRKASAQIRDVIAELDMLMEREFRRTFEAVAKEFRAAFGRLFGGGSARLVLTDAEDFNNVGIDIEAKLPGRREQGLAVLSGGERSLTAAALIFALLKVSPTPFCVLDEVDAMLDESNVLRFIEMVREQSKETQFILITHNRQTVQAAEVIYGISMGADSASRSISLRLDEAIKQVAA